MPIKTIDNFSGCLTRQNYGKLNSGLAKYDTTFGADPFSNPTNLTWFEQPASIMSSATQAIVAAKVRLETTTNYVYAVGSSGPTLYKIKVNDTSTFNPNSDSPSIIGAIPGESGSFIGVLYGASMQLYGSTEKVFIGGDERISKINLDGSGAAKVTAISSVITNVPRPSAQFLGKMYWGNGNNLIEIDSTEAVTSYAKLNPGFPAGTYVRDLDVMPDGNYLQITVSKNNSPSQIQFNPDYSATSSSESYKFYWNGTDDSYSAFEYYPGYSLSTNTVFGQKNYTLGTDLNGTAMYSGSDKILTLPKITPPNFGASFSTGNLLGFVTPEYNSSVIGGNVSSVTGLQASGYLYGQYDEQTPTGLFRVFKQTASVASGDDEVIRVPVCLPISNLTYTYRGAAYANNIIGSSKLYFSTTERQAGDVVYRLYKFMTNPTGSGTAIQGVYETQQEVFSKKIKPTQFRLYTEPLVANNSFKVDLIGSNGNPISGGTQTFTVGSIITAGDDYVQFTPQTAPTYSLGLRITNLGTKNWVAVKAELDLVEGGAK